MIKSHGTIHLKNTPQRRRRFLRSLLLQTILQCLTATGVIVTYHYIASFQAPSETYEQGYGQGYRHAHDLYAPKSK